MFLSSSLVRMVNHVDRQGFLSGGLDDDGDDFCYAVCEAAWLLCSECFCGP